MTSKWISISDEMPKNGEQVLVWNNYLYVGRWERSGKWLSAEDSSLLGGVTHWMPTPKAPSQIRSPIDFLRKIAGEWKVVDLIGRDFDEIWSVLKDRKPFHETSSSHVIELQYEFQNAIYHVCWNISYEEPSLSNALPDSIGIRTSYNWDKK